MGLFDGIGNIIGARRGAKAAKKAYRQLSSAYEQMPDLPDYQAAQYTTDVPTQQAAVERAQFYDPGSADQAKRAAYQSAYSNLDQALNAIPGIRGGVQQALGARAVRSVFAPAAADIEDMARRHGVERAQMQQQVGLANAGFGNAAAQQFAAARNQALLSLAQQRNALSSTDAWRQYQAGTAKRDAAERAAQALYQAKLGQGMARAQAAQAFGQGLGDIFSTAGQAAMMGMGGAGLAAGQAATPWQSAASIMSGWGDPRK